MLRYTPNPRTLTRDTQWEGGNTKGQHRDHSSCTQTLVDKQSARRKTKGEGYPPIGSVIFEPCPGTRPRHPCRGNHRTNRSMLAVSLVPSPSAGLNALGVKGALTARHSFAKTDSLYLIRRRHASHVALYPQSENSN